VRPGEQLDLTSHCRTALDLVEWRSRMDDKEFTKRVLRKQAKQMRSPPGIAFPAGLLPPSDVPAAHPAERGRR